MHAWLDVAGKMQKERQMRPPMAPVMMYRPGQPLQPHQLVYLEMRPGGLYSHVAAIRGVMDQVAGLEESGTALPLRLVPFGRRGALRTTVQSGLAQGLFHDTTLPQQWLGAANRRAGFAAHRLTPLSLVVVHAEHHVDALYDAIVARGDSVASSRGSPRLPRCGAATGMRPSN